MGLVQIYDTKEEVLQGAGQTVYDSNLRTIKTLEGLTQAAMSEYKENSGFNEKWLKRNEKIKTEKPRASTFPPNMVHLPNAEREKFNEQYPDLGKNLELTALIYLSAVGDEYCFYEVSGSGIRSVGPYKDISSLVLDLKDMLQQLKGRFSGAKLTPVFYTTKENKPIVPEEIGNDVEGWLKDITQEIQEEDNLTEESKAYFYGAMKDFSFSKDRYRGLTEAECAEFERLYLSN